VTFKQLLLEKNEDHLLKKQVARPSLSNSNPDLFPPCRIDEETAKAKTNATTNKRGKFRAFTPF
jgi:hypothetical protein